MIHRMFTQLPGFSLRTLLHFAPCILGAAIWVVQPTMVCGQILPLDGDVEGDLNVGPVVPRVGPVIGPTQGPAIGPLKPLAPVGPTLERLPGAVPRVAPGVVPRVDVGGAVPIRLSGEVLSTAGAGANLGMTLDTRGNRLRVSRLTTGNLGAAAGFLVGDEILAVNRTAVRSAGALQSQLNAALATTGQVWISVNRNGIRQVVNLDLAIRPRAKLGVRLEDVGRAVRVATVNTGSVAAKAGLRVGDQILAINGRPVSATANAIAQVQAAARGNGAVEIRYRRAGQVHVVTTELSTATRAGVSGGVRR